MLHTPLMSGANAVHGVIVVGAMLVAATADTPIAIVLAFVAVILGTINVVGGFVVTDRMLEMFKKRPGDRTGTRARWSRSRSSPTSSGWSPASPSSSR